MIKMQVIGHLGRDCNVNSVNGKNVINFSVAHSEKFKNNEGVEVNKTTWVNCAYWVERTSLAQYLVKGIQVFVEGIPEVHSYRSNDGQWKAEQKLRVSQIQLLGGNNRQENNPLPNASAAPVAAPQGGYVPSDQADDDLPF